MLETKKEKEVINYLTKKGIEACLRLKSISKISSNELYSIVENLINYSLKFDFNMVYPTLICQKDLLAEGNEIVKDNTNTGIYVALRFGTSNRLKDLVYMSRTEPGFNWNNIVIVYDELCSVINQSNSIHEIINRQACYVS